MRLPLAVFLISLPLPAALIDRIAITVGNQAITESQIESEIKLAALENGAPPDLGDESRRSSSSRLIEQALVRREMAFGSYPAAPEEQVDSAYASTEKARGGKAQLALDLQRFGLTAKELREYLKWQIALLRFIDLRFRPSVQVSRADVQKYFEENYQARAGTKAPALSELRSQIEDKLTGERVDQEVDRWMEEQRKNTIIRFLDPALGRTTIPPPRKQPAAHVR